MNVYIDNIKFRVDDKSWGSKQNYELKGDLNLFIYKEVGQVLGENITVEKEISIPINNLNPSLKEKFISLFLEVDKFLEENKKDFTKKD